MILAKESNVRHPIGTSATIRTASLVAMVCSVAIEEESEGVFEAAAAVEDDGPRLGGCCCS